MLERTLVEAGEVTRNGSSVLFYFMEGGESSEENEIGSENKERVGWKNFLI